MQDSNVFRGQCYSQSMVIKQPKVLLHWDYQETDVIGCRNAATRVTEWGPHFSRPTFDYR